MSELTDLLSTETESILLEDMDISNEDIFVNDLMNIPIIKGEKGDPGANGIGVPNGGTTGQFLAKKTNADGDTEWKNSTYTLPTASSSVLGGIKIGSNLSIQNGVVSADVSSEDLESKVDEVAGKGLSAEDYTTEEKAKLAGIATNANNYTLPQATSSVLGGVKVGAGLETENDGTVKVKNTTSVAVTVTTQIIQNTNYTVSTYTLNNNSLMIFCEGTKLIKDEHYIEVDTTHIQFKDWDVPVGTKLEFLYK